MLPKIRLLLCIKGPGPLTILCGALHVRMHGLCTWFAAKTSRCFGAFTKAYTLTVLADIGAFPRPGANGRLTARLASVQTDYEDQAKERK